MKRVTLPLEHNKYQKRVTPRLKKEIFEAIRNSKDKLPKSANIVNKLWYLILNYAFLIVAIVIFIVISTKGITFVSNGGKFLWGLTIFLPFLYVITTAWKYLIERKVNKIYLEHMNQELIMKIAFDGLDDVTFVGMKNVLSDYSKSLRVANIPKNARIVSRSPLFSLRIKDKYPIVTQICTYEWIERAYSAGAGNYMNQNVRYETSGFILVDTKAMESSHLFSLFSGRHKYDNMTKISLENRKFNKIFAPWSNDKIKIRMLYTPFSMETSLKQLDKIKITILKQLAKVQIRGIIRKMQINKNKDNITLIFKGLKNQLIIDNRKLGGVNLTTKKYLKDVIEDVYQWYVILSLILIPPLL